MHATHQVVHVVAKPGGFMQAVAFVLGLGAFAAVFVIGLVMGIVLIATLIGPQRPVLVEELYRDGARDRVAIIPIVGPIDGEQAEFARLAIDYVLEDSSIKAVVLRVDSPGGGVSSSDQIWHQVNRLRNAGKTVVASYGGVAASGGYYISCGSDHIVAEPTCVTGSIGVILQTFVVEDMMGKVGIEPVTLVSSGSPDKDLGNPFRQWTQEDRERYRAILDSAYDTFCDRVKTGRKSVIEDPAKVDALADGSIYTADAALENGLIDAIGYLDDAVNTAEQMAGLVAGRASVVILRRPPAFLGGMLARGWAQPVQTDLLDAEKLRELLNDLSAPRVMYLMK